MFDEEPSDVTLTARVAALEAMVAALGDQVATNAADAQSMVDALAEERATGDAAAQKSVIDERSGRIEVVRQVNDLVGDLAQRVEAGDRLNSEQLVDKVQQADRSRILSEVAKGEAQSAALTAAIGVIYQTKEIGNAVTDEGGSFAAYGPTRNYVTRYVKTNGQPVAVDSYPNSTRFNDMVTSMAQLASKSMSDMVYRGNGPILPELTSLNEAGIDVMLRGIRPEDGAQMHYAQLDGPGFEKSVVRELQGYINDWEFSGPGNEVPIVMLGSRAIFYFDRARQRAVLSDVIIEGDHQLTVTAGGGGSRWPRRLSWTEGYNGLIGFGQSNSIGAGGQPALSLTQPFANVTFIGGVKSSSSSDMSAFGPLIENNLGEDNATGTIRGETTLSTACNSVVARANATAGIATDDYRIFACTGGQGGTAITGLSKGTAPYLRLMAQITAAKALAMAAGKAFVIQAIDWMQGETDSDQQVTTILHLGRLLQLVADLNTDIKAITGQTTDVHLLLSQPAHKAASTGGAVQLAQFYAVQQSPLIHFVTSTQHLDYYSDWLHLSNTGHQHHGGYVGRAYYQLVVEQRAPDCLWPLEATVNGNQVRCRFRVPTLPLVLDATNLAATLNHGLKVVDDSGTLSLSGIAVSGESVVMTIDRALGANPWLRYSIDYRGAGLGISGAGTGNIRDSTPGTVLAGGVDRPLWHLPPHFKLPILKQMSA